MPKHEIKNKIAIEAFGLRVRQLRDLRNISQQELADTADIAKPTIQRIERGSTSPGLDIIISIANALEVTPIELFAERVKL